MLMLTTENDMRATYDNTLHTDTILKIMSSLENHPRFRFLDSPQRKRHSELKEELTIRGLIKNKRKPKNHKP